MNLHNEMIIYEPPLRICFFLIVLTLVACFEMIFQLCKPMVSKKLRWYNDFLIHLINSLPLRIIFPFLPIAMAVAGLEKGWGLFNHYDVNPWISVTFGIAILDLLIYLHHVLFHKASILWRLHRVHHLDLDIDVTTGVRFHPFEMIMSTLIKSASVFIFVIPAFAVLIFEILLNNASMFNHGNIRIPVAIDRRLRLLLVTLDMNRVYHSVTLRENNSNFGFSVSSLDFLFGTYVAQPAAGNDAMTIGLAGFLDMKHSLLWKMLTATFIRRKEA